ARLVGSLPEFQFNSGPHRPKPPQPLSSVSPISEDERRGPTQERFRAFKRSSHGESVNSQFIFSFLSDTGTVCFAMLRQRFQLQLVMHISLLIVFTVAVTSFAGPKLNATTTAGATGDQKEIPKTPSPREHTGSPSNLDSAEDWNRRLRDRSGSVDPGPRYDPQEYVIGPEDVLDINVFEATEMNRGVRVSASGEISLPLLGAVAAAGLTPRELETTLEELLRQKYMKDPHVSVFVRDLQSHPVSVMGAVRMPGVFQIRGKKTLVEILSLAEGLADDAGETVVILRRPREKNAPEFASVKTNDMAGSSPWMRSRDVEVPGPMDMDPEKAGAISQN